MSSTQSKTRDQSELAMHDRLLKKLWKSADPSQVLVKSSKDDAFLVPLVRGLNEEEFTFLDTVVTTSDFEDSHPEPASASHPIRRFFAPFLDVLSHARPASQYRDIAWPEGWAEKHIEQSIRTTDKGAFEALRDAMAAEKKARQSVPTL